MRSLSLLGCWAQLLTPLHVWKPALRYCWVTGTSGAKDLPRQPVGKSTLGRVYMLVHVVLTLSQVGRPSETGGAFEAGPPFLGPTS